jgi:hypothetical protein
MPKRTIDSIQMRLANYVARDPEMKKAGVKGMFGGGEHVDDIWNQFANDEGSLDLQKLVQAAAQILGSNKS